ncbi:hypothetical protein [Marinobacter sp.]|uniref:hypothetical protein n=1 Tax=Marinobacter sp. TaxID=50741 RepID=UPI0035670BD2
MSMPIVRKQLAASLLAAAIMTGCSSTPGDMSESGNGSITTYRTGDVPFSYPESLLTGYNSRECLKWSNSNIVATDKLFLFNAAGMTPNQSETLAKRLDGEINKLSTSLDWAPYRWLDSLPVINQPNGAALFADSLVSLDRQVGTARISSELAEKNASSVPTDTKPMFVAQTTKQVEVLNYVLPGFKPVNDWRAPSHHVYKHFLKLPRKERVEAVRRFNQMSAFDAMTDKFEMLPGRILVCVYREQTPLSDSESHDMGINIKAGASDQAIRSALVGAYQAARTRAYGQLDDLIPEWFLVGQRVFHGGERVAQLDEALYNSPINSHGSSYSKKPENYPALSGLAYKYIGESNEMSLIASLLDAVRYRDMPAIGVESKHPERFFNQAFNDRMRALDDGPLTLRGFDYGWNGFVGELHQMQ